MRVLFVWFTALVGVFSITVGWLVGMGLVTTIESQAMTDITGQGFSLMTLIEYVASWWGPIFDIIVILWAIMNSQETDPYSRIGGY